MICCNVLCLVQYARAEHLVSSRLSLAVCPSLLMCQLEAYRFLQ